MTEDYDSIMGNWDHFQRNILGPNIDPQDDAYPSLVYKPQDDMSGFQHGFQHNHPPSFQHDSPSMFGFQQQQQQPPQHSVISQSQPVAGRKGKRKSMNPAIQTTNANTSRRPVFHPGQELVNASHTIMNTAQEFRQILSNEALEVQKEQGRKIAELERKLERLLKKPKTSPPSLVAPAPLLLEHRPVTPALESHVYNMIPWIWVLKNVGIHLRMVELHELSTPGDISVRVVEDLITRVAIMVTDYKKPNTPQLFSFQRYRNDQDQVVNDVNTVECWQAKVKKYFGNLSEQVPLTFLRDRVRIVEGHPEYENFGMGLMDEQLFKAAMKELQTITNRRSKVYGVMRDGKTIKLNPSMDTALFNIVKKPSSAEVFVSVSSNWDIDIVQLKK